LSIANKPLKNLKLSTSTKNSKGSIVQSSPRSFSSFPVSLVRRFSSSSPPHNGAPPMFSPTDIHRSQLESFLEEPPLSPNSSQDLSPDLFALISLDGTIKFQGISNKIWELQVDHQLFAISKLDLNGDKRQEIVTCSWDGLTYIVDHDQNVVRFQFPGSVCAFVAGFNFFFFF